MFHHTDNMAKLRNIRTENAVTHHAPKLSDNTCTVVQQLYKYSVMLRVLAIVVVNQMTVITQSTNGFRMNAFSLQCASHQDRKSTRLNSSHVRISYAVFCLKKK